MTLFTKLMQIRLLRGIRTTDKLLLKTLKMNYQVRLYSKQLRCQRTQQTCRVAYQSQTTRRREGTISHLRASETVKLILRLPQTEIHSRSPKRLEVIVASCSRTKNSQARGNRAWPLSTTFKSTTSMITDLTLEQQMRREGFLLAALHRWATLAP